MLRFTVLTFLVFSIPYCSFSQLALEFDINQKPSSSHPFQFTKVGETVFFIADDGTHGEEVWKHDLTTGETLLVTDIREGALSSAIGSFHVFEEMIYMSAISNTSDRLHRLDPATGEVLEFPPVILLISRCLMTSSISLPTMANKVKRFGASHRASMLL